jgi:hypothetical protein
MKFVILMISLLSLTCFAGEKAKTDRKPAAAGDYVCLEAPALHGNSEYSVESQMNQNCDRAKPFVIDVARKGNWYVCCVQK